MWGAELAWGKAERVSGINAQSLSKSRVWSIFCFKRVEYKAHTSCPYQKKRESLFSPHKRRKGQLGKPLSSNKNVNNYYNYTSFFFRKNSVMFTTHATPVTKITRICTTGHHTAAAFIFWL